MSRPLLAVAILAALIALSATAPRTVARASGPMPHEAYVWQRAWTDQVRATIAHPEPRPALFNVLAAEVSWDHGQPQVTKVAVDYAALKASGVPVGLSLRIGNYPGPFATEGQPFDTLAAISHAVVSEARDAGVEPVEFQLDFDCAESKLGGYRTWVRELTRVVAPTPLTITALPSWLKQKKCGALLKSTTGFVLQVHGMERPEVLGDPVSLCDPVASRGWIEEAARHGVPFRVALPTYTYMLAYKPDGSFLGLSAEGPSRAWPDDLTVRPLSADAVAMAALVEELGADRPANCTGVIWFRYPMPADRYNWSREVWAAVVAGQNKTTEVAR